MRSRRRVTFDRDGHFTIDSHPYWLTKSQHILTEEEWEVWDLDPDMSIGRTGILASPGPGPDRPVACAATYTDMRDRIDRAAIDGRFFH